MVAPGLVLKEFEPSFSQGGDMPQDFLAPATKVKELETSGESAMKASLAKGMPHGYEVGYRYFTIDGRMLGHGEPVRAKQGERVLFHVLNAFQESTSSRRSVPTLKACSRDLLPLMRSLFAGTDALGRGLSQREM
jgi:hypothetical protein